jgi:hypothetical protein
MMQLDIAPLISPAKTVICDEVQMFLGPTLSVGIIRPASGFMLRDAALSWLIAHAALHVREVAMGICSPSTILRDFLAVSLPALIGVTLTT